MLGCGVDGVLAYLAHVSEVYSSSVSTGYTHLSAIAHKYKTNGVTGVTDDSRIAMYMKGLKRRNQGSVVVRATPMTPEILTAMRRMLYRKPSLILWRTIWRAYMEFCLMLRYMTIKFGIRKILNQIMKLQMGRRIPVNC